jgi:transposase-like protein
MTDVPGSLIAFQQHFPDEAACAAYLAAVRWPHGFVCPRCGHSKAWLLQTKAWTYECASCRKQTSVTAGTILHGSKLPLTLWFWAAYLMATHSNGISALQLQHQLALGSYKTAWLLCAKLRASMVAPERNPLSGLVEVDETEIACRSKNDPPAGGGGRSHHGKILVVGAVEMQDGGAGPGRIRLQEVSDYSAASLHPFLATNLAPGATARPTAGLVILAPRAFTTILIRSARWLLISCYPGPTASFPISKPGHWVSITACAASTSSPTSTNSFSASIAAITATLVCAPYSASPPAMRPSPTRCWSHRKQWHKPLADIME